ncbi:hypothetical protein Anas_00428 [Armadillidium nasatum]|uniref:Uncharacterized protein n=1 Tax=Armadillidium nasatum TaxID=96803 RepID=A0A5N5T5P9_9CRUS|nr:hypothetical protein Anas_00428 [Armadillidium nasatum]
MKFGSGEADPRQDIPKTRGTSLVGGAKESQIKRDVLFSHYNERKKSPNFGHRGTMVPSPPDIWPPNGVKKKLVEIFVKKYTK